MKKSTLNPLAATAAYYSIFIVLGLVTAATGPTLPALANQTGSLLKQISIIFITGSIGYMIGSFLSGRIYDRLPGHRIMAMSVLLIALCTAFIPVVPALWMLAAVIFISGIAQGAVDVGGNTLLSWIHGSGVGPYMNGLHFFFGVGSFIAPVTVAQIVGATGQIHWVYWAFSLFMLPVAAVIWLLPGPTVRHETKHGSGVISPILLGLIVSFFFLYVGAELGYGNWIFTYAFKGSILSETNAAYLTSAFWGFFTIGRLAGVVIATRVKPLTILAMDLVSCLLSIGLILALPASPVVLWVGTILIGLSMASVFPTMITLAEQRLGLTGSVTSWFLIGAGGGGMFWPWLIGQVFEGNGPGVMPWLVATTLGLNLVALILITTQKMARNA